MSYYEKLKSLSDEQLIDGIKKCYTNSLSQYNSGKLFGEQEYFGQATALLILSLEELIKAIAIFFVYVELDNKELLPNLVNDVFKSRNIHKYRLGLAFIFNQLYMSKQMSEMFDQIDAHISKVPNFTVPDYYSDSEKLDIADKIINSILPSIELTEVDELSSEINDSIDKYNKWFSGAQEIKLRGLYVDLNENEWQTPQNVGIEDYEDSFKYVTGIQENLRNIIEDVINGDDLRKKILKLSVNRFSKLNKD